MRRTLRTALYGVAGAVLLIAALAAPGAWATPGQIGLTQTVPTRTPTPGPVPPTVRPPNVTAVPPTAAPGASPTAPIVVPPGPGAGPLVLTKSADRRAVWPGATVTYTVVVRNSGSVTLRQVSVEDVLPRGLAPVAVVRGAAAWTGSTLRLNAASLAPGARLEVVYTVRVTAVDDAGASTVHEIPVEVADADPEAIFTETCTGGVCTFDGSGSTDPDGDVVSHDWDFGDGGDGSGAQVAHTFEEISLDSTVFRGEVNCNQQLHTGSGMQIYVLNILILSKFH